MNSTTTYNPAGAGAPDALLYVVRDTSNAPTPRVPIPGTPQEKIAEPVKRPVAGYLGSAQYVG